MSRPFCSPKSHSPFAQPLHFRSLEAQPRPETTMQLTSTFSLSNTCVVFVKEGYRRCMPKFISRDGVAALVHAFSEFTFGFNRLTGVWPALPEDSGNLSQCDERQHAIGMFFSNNFGHQVFHAVSAWGALHGRYQAAAARGSVAFCHCWAGSRAQPYHAVGSSPCGLSLQTQRRRSCRIRHALYTRAAAFARSMWMSAACLLARWGQLRARWRASGAQAP